MTFISLNPFKRIVVLTGAGISAESGIKTFRDADGLWENHRVEDVATPEAFNRDPRLVWRFYSMRRQAAAQAIPNEAHKALVNFAKQSSQSITLITQNVDTLHERADLEHRLEPICMHGSLERSRCSHCETVYLDDMVWLTDDLSHTPVSAGLLSSNDKASEISITQYRINYRDGMPLSPCCNELLRPHIVWFGEIPLHMERIERTVSECDLFVSIGTSGVVYPAAGFLRFAKENGAQTICINLESISQSSFIDHFYQGKAGEVVPHLFTV